MCGAGLHFVKFSSGSTVTGAYLCLLTGAMYRPEIGDVNDFVASDTLSVHLSRLLIKHIALF